MKTDHTGSIKNTLLSFGAQESNAVLDIGCGTAEYTFIIAQKVKSAVGAIINDKFILSLQKEIHIEETCI